MYETFRRAGGCSIGHMGDLCPSGEAGGGHMGYSRVSKLALDIYSWWRETFPSRTSGLYIYLCVYTYIQVLKSTLTKFLGKRKGYLGKGRHMVLQDMGLDALETVSCSSCVFFLQMTKIWAGIAAFSSFPRCKMAGGLQSGNSGDTSVLLSKWDALEQSDGFSTV